MFILPTLTRQRCLASVILSGMLLLSLTSCKPRSTRIVRGPYVLNVTQTSITIVWQTDHARIGRVLCISEEGKQKRWKETQPSRLHVIDLDNLDPDTRYTYEVTSGFDAASGSFHTATKPGMPFRFGVYGTRWDDLRSHRRIAEVLGLSVPDFIVSTGGLVATTPASVTLDEQFFNPLRSVINHIPLYACPGSFDSDAQDYNHIFVSRRYDSDDTKERTSWRAFDYGDARFVLLNSSQMEGDAGRAQYAWIEAQLQSHHQLWTCVFMHNPLYESDRNGDTINLDTWAKLFMKYGVDLVFSGHDPVYERSYPIWQLLEDNSSAVTYIITGGNTTPSVSFQPHVWTAHSGTGNHFLVVDIDGKRLDLVAYRDNGEVFDTLTLHKRADGPNRPPEQMSYEQIQLERSLENSLAPSHLLSGTLGDHLWASFPLANPLQAPVTLDIEWDLPIDTNWQIDPSLASVVFEPNQRQTLTFDVVPDEQKLYPTPVFRLRYRMPFGEGEIRGRHVQTPFQRHLVCLKTLGKINPYGRFVEDTWRHAAETKGRFLRISPVGYSEYSTKVRVAYDKSAFYFAFELTDPDPVGLHIEQQGSVDLTRDDAVGIYLSPPSGGVYLFIFNGDGIQRTVRDGRPMGDQGWIVNTAKQQESWSAEVRLPFECLDAVPMPGQRWKVQFLRNQRTEGLSVWCINNETPSLGILEIN